MFVSINDQRATCIQMILNMNQISLIPRLHSPAFLAPCRNAGREPGIFHHVLRDVGCAVWCVVLLIELRVTFSNVEWQVERS